MISVHRDCSRRGRLRRIKVADWPLDFEVILEGIDAACAFRHVEDSGTFGNWGILGISRVRDRERGILEVLRPLAHYYRCHILLALHLSIVNMFTAILHCPSD
ncbi:hypothetical protein E4U50_007894 [Claviceps purpurea]|nr:hypothetical protein E4U50_007894 [Claviceps purpurea]